MNVLEGGRIVSRVAKQEGWMREDEDMMNVALWRDKATKERSQIHSQVLVHL